MALRRSGSIIETRSVIAAARSDGRSIGFVPTMGALHDGHLSLVRAAGKECDFVVVSIFVNPLQFGDSADLESYPSDVDADIEALHVEDVDLLFAPTVEEMYPQGKPATEVHVAGLGDRL